MNSSGGRQIFVAIVFFLIAGTLFAQSQWPNKGIRVSASDKREGAVQAGIGDALWTFFTRTDNDQPGGANDVNSIIFQKIDRDNGNLLLGDEGNTLVTIDSHYIPFEVHQTDEGSFIVVWEDNSGNKILKAARLTGVNGVVQIVEFGTLLDQTGEWASHLVEENPGGAGGGQVLLVISTDRQRRTLYALTFDTTNGGVRTRPSTPLVPAVSSGTLKFPVVTVSTEGKSFVSYTHRDGNNDLVKGIQILNDSLVAEWGPVDCIDMGGKQQYIAYYSPVALGLQEKFGIAVVSTKPDGSVVSILVDGNDGSILGSSIIRSVTGLTESPVVLSDVNRLFVGISRQEIVALEYSRQGVSEQWSYNIAGLWLEDMEYIQGGNILMVTNNVEDGELACMAIKSDTKEPVDGWGEGFLVIPDGNAPGLPGSASIVGDNGGEIFVCWTNSYSNKDDPYAAQISITERQVGVGQIAEAAGLASDFNFSSNGPHSIRLLWDPEPSGARIDSWEVSRAVRSGDNRGDYIVIADNLSADSVSYTDENLSEAAEYEYRVRGKAAGYFSNPHWVSALSSFLNTPGIIVTRVNDFVLGENVRIEVIDNSDYEESYIIERKGEEDEGYTQIAAVDGSDIYNDTEVRPNHTYLYRVKAIGEMLITGDGSGTERVEIESGYSDVAKIFTGENSLSADESDNEEDSGGSGGALSGQLSQLIGGSNITSQCYIATAAIGDTVGTRSLREFRSGSLVRNSVGSISSELYHRCAPEAAAKLSANRPSLFAILLLVTAILSAFVLCGHRR